MELLKSLLIPFLLLSLVGCAITTDALTKSQQSRLCDKPTLDLSQSFPIGTTIALPNGASYEVTQAILTVPTTDLTKLLLYIDCLEHL